MQHAKVATLEKQNRDLSWQVAMLARPGVTPARPTAAAGLPAAPMVCCTPRLTPAPSVLCAAPHTTFHVLGNREARQDLFGCTAGLPPDTPLPFSSLVPSAWPSLLSCTHGKKEASQTENK